MKTLKKKLIYGITGLIFKCNLVFSQNIIYVNNKNDPRLKAYQDSLDSYNNYEIMEDIIKNLPENKFKNNDELNNYVDSIEKKYPANHDLQITEEYTKTIKIFIFSEGRGFNSKQVLRNYFKYPIQKVVYLPAEKIYENKTHKKPQTELDKSGKFVMFDGQSYTYKQLIESFPKMKNDLVFKKNFPGRVVPKE